MQSSVSKDASAAARKASESLYRACALCPRACRVDRLAGARGYCGQAARARAAWAGLHFGEEPPITGHGGSGAVFFSGCSVRCSFCQNRQISHGGMGADLRVNELARLFLALQRAGAANVNLVTGTPHLPRILEALADARRRGLSLPVVWNTSSYETPETLVLLEPQVDVYLADLKTLDPALAKALCGAPGYPEIARRALLTMAEQKPLRLQGNELAGGVIVRHLVLPGNLEAAHRCLEWYQENLYPSALLSLMFQYTPVPGAAAPRGGPVLPSRGISQTEQDTVLGWLEELGIEEGFVQELPGDSSWLPDFSTPDPFPRGQARTLWHWRAGRR